MIALCFTFLSFHDLQVVYETLEKMGSKNLSTSVIYKTIIFSS